MPTILFKQLCNKCKKSYVTVSYKQKPILCYECQKPLLEGRITDNEMRSFFNIPEDYYKESLFLRNIKVYYLNFGKLTDKQIQAFKNAVERLKASKKT